MIRSAIPKPREMDFTKPRTWAVRHYYDHINVEVACVVPGEYAYGVKFDVDILDFVHDPVGTRIKAAKTIRRCRSLAAEGILEPTKATIALAQIMGRVRAEETED